LTEDIVRFATARALIAAGVDPAGLRVEWPHPELPSSRGSDRPMLAYHVTGHRIQLIDF
jgi:hypothetical protein